jgi:hypothetical protein
MKNPLSRLTKDKLLDLYFAEQYDADGEYPSPQTVIETTHLTKAQLIVEIKRARAYRLDSAERASRAKCPKGHKPGDPKCNVMCHIVMLEPLSSPFEAPRVASPALHSWVNDELTPVKPEMRPPEVLYTAREWMKNHPEALQRLSIHERMEYLEPLAKAYRELEAQFTRSKRPNWFARRWNALLRWYDGLAEWLWITRD